MDFNWFIPGPVTRVFAGFSCSNPRPMLSHKDLDTYAGCLLYGNNWTRDRGNFLPHITDKNNIVGEGKSRDCSINLSEGSTNDGDSAKQATLALQSGIETNLDVFLPSDPKNPNATLTHVEAKVLLTLDPSDPKKYIHNIELKANPFRDSKPIFKDIMLRPEQNYISLYADNPTVQKYKLKEDAITLPSEMTLSTHLDIPDAPELRSVRFELSSYGILGATLFVPYLVKGQ